MNTSNNPQTKAPMTKKKIELPVYARDIEPWSESVDLCSLLENIKHLFEKHIVLTDGVADVLALWTVFSHSYDAFQLNPRLAITSPEKECGKSTLLTLLDLLVRRPFYTSNITTAAIFRTIDAYKCTLLIDEADTHLSGHAETTGILNSGHARRTAVVARTVGDNYEPRPFSTWAPVAIALIGKLRDTLASRCIPIKMYRKLGTEQVEPLMLHDGTLISLCEEYSRKAARWTADNCEALQRAKPHLPVELQNRAADNWFPLLVIAEFASDEWAARVRSVAIALTSKHDEPSWRELVLRDIKSIFDECGEDRLASNELCRFLGKIEGRPWAEFDQGIPITVHQLAKLLKPFEIAPKVIRTNSTSTPRGYERRMFEPVWERYLDTSPESATPQQLDKECEDAPPIQAA